VAMANQIHLWLNEHPFLFYCFMGAIILGLILIMSDWNALERDSERNSPANTTFSGKRSTVALIGSVIALISTVFAIIFGLAVDFIIALFSFQDNAIQLLGAMGIILIAFGLLVVNFILIIISFFRNTGKTILVISIILFVLYIIAHAPLNIVLSAVTLLASLMIMKE
jgi:hypothetical protein